MNAPAKRFSLQRLLTSAPAPAAEPVRVIADPPPAPAPVVVEAPPAPVVLAPVPPPAALPALARLPKGEPAADVSHPKKKRSYSVDMGLCEDLELLAWYQDRSSSSVVEELIRKHLQHNRALLQKARDVHSAR
jgi:hypothetical protein